MDNVYGRLERGDLNLDHVKAFGIGVQRTPTGLDVRHACPYCELGNPRPLCQACAGHGTLNEEQLARVSVTPLT